MWESQKRDSFSWPRSENQMKTEYVTVTVINFDYLLPSG